MTETFREAEAPVKDGPGVLYIVATPIGNLDDISRRAVSVLERVDLVAAEDTRHSGRLLQHLGLSKRLMALHDHNEAARAGGVLDQVAAGMTVALISDAGTPLISDPGYVLVREARLRGITVVPVPGACALVAALSAAGLPTDRFVFEGFLPAKAAARRARLQALARETATLIFYESPRRVQGLLADVVTEWGGERELVLARELTKAHETFYTGTAESLVTVLADDSYGQKGEFVVIARGAPEPDSSAPAIEVDRLLTLLLAELPVKKVARIGAEVTGASRNELYQRALQLKDDA